MPMYATMFLIAALSSMGLPALNGFIGEFTILLGTANSSAINSHSSLNSMGWAALASLGIVLGAAYLLWLYQRVFWGPLDNPANKNVPDLNRRELGLLLALVAVMVWIGIFPGPLFLMIEEPVNYIVRKVDPAYFDKNERMAGNGTRNSVVPVAASQVPLAASTAPLAAGATEAK
jgi:NADH-quinone oxidoreductase subunit M